MFSQVKKKDSFLFILKLHCNLIIFLQSYNELQTVMKPTLSSISLFPSLCFSDGHERLLKKNKYKSIF